MEQNETWKPVKGFEGLYEVSNLGNVRSLLKGKCQQMVLNKDNHGYKRVALFKDGIPSYKAAHRLVAEAFIPNPDGLPCVNHKDENPSNNIVDNLEWCTYDYNSNYGTRNARIKKAITEKYGTRVYQFTLDGDFVAEYPSFAEAARAIHNHPSSIRHSCLGEIGPVGGFLWAKVEKS